MAVTLYGYSYSVYLRIVRMTMLEKGVVWSHVEVDPFADEIPPDYLALHPFGRVPTLDHDGFVLYETTAITCYIDETFGGPSLQPEAPRERARMNQIIAIADSYGYWPMVRQVFSQRVFNARRRTPDEAMIAEELARSHKVLSALESLAGGGGFLVGDRLTLADLHLGAMVAYFTAAGEGAIALCDYPKLSAWWAAFRNRKSLAENRPGTAGRLKRLVRHGYTAAGQFQAQMRAKLMISAGLRARRDARSPGGRNPAHRFPGRPR